VSRCLPGFFSASGNPTAVPCRGCSPVAASRGERPSVAGQGCPSWGVTCSRTTSRLGWDHASVASTQSGVPEWPAWRIWINGLDMPGWASAGGSARKSSTT
jgi:hypothetical protein